mmetsp:Transcript_38669/g.82986  ORF Transcript_38669/g.82986 Transcript_38669/m.82986 type:complete len:151 (-) Transcript_38669:111-563(-)
MLGKVVRFLGRVLFAFLFISSGLSKVQGFYEDGTKLVSMLQPRITQAVGHAWTALHLDGQVDRPTITPAVTAAVLYCLVGLELVGGTSFIIFPRVGSALLAALLVSNTLINYNYYNYESLLKNVALLGTCVMMLGQRPGLHAPVHKVKSN